VSCILRVLGEHLDIEQMLNDIPLEANRFWKKGERRFNSDPDSRLLPKSGASFIASDAEMNEFEIQLEEATKYLQDNMFLIKRITKYSGVEEATIDFGVELRDMEIHCDYLSPEFVANVSKAGIGIEISHYPCNEDEQTS
jgi:hypothetical protein